MPNIMKNLIQNKIISSFRKGRRRRLKPKKRQGWHSASYSGGSEFKSQPEVLRCLLPL
jgi:hypothetical protein